MPLLHSIQYGSGSRPTLVFLHGFMGDSSDWKRIIDPLQFEWRCLAIDLPGHGGSLGLDDATYEWAHGCGAALATIYEAGVAEWVLVGYSMGARMALQLALERPPGLVGLVLESGTAGLRSDVDRARRASQDRETAARLRAADMVEFLRDWYAQPLFESLQMRHDLLDEIVLRRSVNDPAEVARALVGLSVAQQPDSWGRIEELAIPVQLICGAEDPKYASLASDLQRSMRHARVTIVPGAGHAVHLESPDEFREALCSFASDVV